MSTRLDCPSLASVLKPAPSTPPYVPGERIHVLAQRVIDRDAQPIAVHACHHALEVRAVVRTALQDIILPLVDHLMRQRADDFRFDMWAARCQALKQWKRQANKAAIGGEWGGITAARSYAAIKEAHGSCQPGAPENVDSRERVTKIAGVELLPLSIEIGSRKPVE
jgi:hypothetical protein